MSGEKVPYHLRQNKHVERQLFIDILAHVNRVRPIGSYLYVGFGGAYLEDFRVIHSEFGNTAMLSLESEPWVYQRQLLNVPYGCVLCENKTSAQFIENYDQIVATFSKASNVLLWLDYADPSRLRQQITEYQSLVEKLRAHDIVKITLNANPATLGEAAPGEDPKAETPETRQIHRFERLRSRLGDYLPTDAGSEGLTPAGYPAILVKALHVASQRALRSSDLLLQPLGIFTYNDAVHQMLTVTCIALQRNSVEQFLEQSGMNQFEFRSLDWKQSVHISVPYLSTREKFYLDQIVYKRTKKRDHSQLKASARLKLTLGKKRSETDELIRQYLRFYRYYPHYHRVQY